MCVGTECRALLGESELKCAEDGLPVISTDAHNLYAAVAFERPDAVAALLAHFPEQADTCVTTLPEDLSIDELDCWGRGEDDAGSGELAEDDAGGGGTNASHGNTSISGGEGEAGARRLRRLSSHSAATPTSAIAISRKPQRPPPPPVINPPVAVADRVDEALVWGVVITSVAAVAFVGLFAGGLRRRLRWLLEGRRTREERQKRRRDWAVAAWKRQESEDAARAAAVVSAAPAAVAAQDLNWREFSLRAEGLELEQVIEMAAPSRAAKDAAKAAAAAAPYMCYGKRTTLYGTMGSLGVEA